MRATFLIAIMLATCTGRALAGFPFTFRSSKVEIRVVDDQGKPVAKTSMGMGVTGSGKGGIARGETDTNGMFSARLKMEGSVYLRAEKSGYYRTAGELWSGPTTTTPLPPTNQYTIVLKRIANPVPMITREVSLIMPRLGTPCGFDLVAGDWVAPHGTGVVADCHILGKKVVEDYRNWDLGCRLIFTNRNGVVGFRAPGSASYALKSDLVPPPVAPEEGYVAEYAFAHSYHAGVGSSASADNNDHLLFRVRSETNDEGRVVSAHSGWVEGALRLDGRNTDTMWMGFIYHLNPDPTSRSLEPLRR